MPHTKKILGIIPCRLASTRLAQKALIPILGKPLIQHVFDGAKRSLELSKIIIATDAKEIADIATSFGAEVMMTRADHATGSDRIWEVAEKYSEYTLIVNIQGDEPLIDEQVISALIKPFRSHPDCVMSSLKREIEDPEEIQNPNIVKVVCDHYGRALYFSRYPIPFPREKEKVRYYRHIGLYAYRRDFLSTFRNWERSPLEKTESLEQLRVLENGFQIYMEDCPVDTVDVNVAQDIERATAKLKMKAEQVAEKEIKIKIGENNQR
jgi:3-deoxy-manno-octulosonate cytidylyltransferase (CMP-KDO synthetase)